ncbi:MAG: DUF4037 domain-containing protein, partial [Acidimicrobiia bacterium]
MTSTPGLELARAFYEEELQPIVDRVTPRLRYSAARIGRGSEVLGFDDQVSRDHDWGPRLEIFLNVADFERYAEVLDEAFATTLPSTSGGYPTSFAIAADGVGIPASMESDERIDHRVEVHDLGQWCQSMLGFDPRHGITSFDWLATSSHRLAEVTGGAVFHDGLGELGPMRAALDYYPEPIWRFILASHWTRIGQEEAFVGRCAQVGDDLGSTIIAARIARDLMRLCLTMERQYLPYAKWLGTAFARLDIAEVITPHLIASLQSHDSDLRQREIGIAYEIVAKRHNELGLTDVIDENVRPFWGRRFPVIFPERFAEALQHGLRETDLADL